jgi:predicted Fe-Mo cluster-binding NifX family protein
MKIGIAIKEENLESDISDVFGRSPYFAFVSVENGEITETEIEENKSVDQVGGAGISAAEAVAQKGINFLIANNVGPRATDVLKQFNVTIHFEEGNAKEVLERFIKGKLEI